MSSGEEGAEEGAGLGGCWGGGGGGCGGCLGGGWVGCHFGSWGGGVGVDGRGGVLGDWQWCGTRRELCFASIRKEAMSGESRWRRVTFIHGKKSVRGYRIWANGAGKRKFLNSVRASIGNDLVGESEAWLRKLVAIVLRIIEGP